MKFLARSIGLIIASVLASSAYADVDGTKVAICATVEIMDCVPHEGCQRVSASEAGIPRFLRIDFAGNKITRSQPSGDEVTSEIERSEEVDGRLILQGAEDGVEDVPDGIGWSLSIDKTSGNMVLTGSGVDVGFVIFGACTPL